MMAASALASSLAFNAPRAARCIPLPSASQQGSLSGNKHYISLLEAEKSDDDSQKTE